jgi:tRNA pseudouridine65 synthase
MSKHKEATIHATEQFMSKQTEKTYFTIIRGWPQEESGTLEKPLKNAKGVVQDAVTKFKVIHKVELPVQISKFPTARYSLLKCTPITGRQHQIRRHVRHLTGPIIGDTKFGKKEHNEYFKNELHCSNLLLFSAQLKLSLYSGQENIFKTDLPDSFQHLCNEFNWSKELILTNY